MQIGYKLALCHTLKAVTIMIILSVNGRTWASERLGRPVWDVGQIPSGMNWAKSTHIFVYGAFTSPGNSGIIKDVSNPPRSIDVDLKSLGRKENRHLRNQCALRACSNIFEGFMLRNRFYPIEVISYHGTNQLLGAQALVR